MILVQNQGGGAAGERDAADGGFDASARRRLRDSWGVPLPDFVPG